MTRLTSTMLASAMGAMLLGGCPGDDGSTDTGAGTSTGGGPTSTTVADTEATSADTSASGGATSMGATTEATSATTGDTTGPGGEPCGEVVCGEAEYCDYNTNLCGDADFDMPTCVARPQDCPDLAAPVCGCDGQVYGNDCEAAAAGVDVDAEGTCEAPDGTFPCGFRFCDLSFEYCQVSVSDVGGFGDGFACLAPAAVCDPIACDCLTEEACFEFGCEETPEGGHQIVCPGG